jgi:hypothetical protein
MIRGLLLAGGISETRADQIAYSEPVKDADIMVKKKAKKKLTAWHRYVKQEMPRMRKAFPRSRPAQLMKRIARKWKTSAKNPNRKRKARRT